MDLAELRNRLRELKRLAREQDPNEKSQMLTLFDDLAQYQLTVVWALSLGEYVVTDDEE